MKSTFFVLSIYLLFYIIFTNKREISLWGSVVTGESDRYYYMLWSTTWTPGERKLFPELALLHFIFIHVKEKKKHIRCVFADTITLQRCLMARLSDGSQILNCLFASEFLVPCIDLKLQSGYKIYLHKIQYILIKNWIVIQCISFYKYGRKSNWIYSLCLSLSLYI